MLKQERLLELFDYNTETGQLVRRISVSSNAQKGQVVGSLNKHGHLTVRVDGKAYYLHSLVWFYVTEEWPLMLDHRDRVKTNCRFDNLRKTNHSLNALNAGAHKDSSTGVKGVSVTQHGFTATIRRDSKSHFLGNFKTLEEGQRAYEAACLKLEQELNIG